MSVAQVERAAGVLDGGIDFLLASNDLWVLQEPLDVGSTEIGDRPDIEPA